MSASSSSSPAPPASSNTAATSSSSSSSLPQPPKESFARRYKFLWPMLLTVNLAVGGNFVHQFLVVLLMCLIERVRFQNGKSETLFRIGTLC